MNPSLTTITPHHETLPINGFIQLPQAAQNMLGSSGAAAAAAAAAAKAAGLSQDDGAVLAPRCWGHSCAFAIEHPPSINEYGHSWVISGYDH